MKYESRKWQEVDIEKVDIKTLVDIQSVVIDETLPKQERIDSFIQQIKNPYCFRCGNVVVKVSFATSGDTMEERIEKIILA